MSDFEGVVHRALAKTREAFAHKPTSGEVHAAAVLVEDLRPLSLDQRRLVVRNSAKHRTVAVAQRLFAVATEDAAEDPRFAHEWLGLLDVLLDSSEFDRPDPVAAVAAELTVRAQALRVVTYAKQGSYREAEVVLKFAKEMETRDTLTAGELLEAEANLAAVQQQLERAMARLREARELYRSIDDEHLVGRVLLKMSYAQGESGLYSEAVQFGLEALETLDPKRDRRLMLVAVFNLARYLKDAGRLTGSLSVIARAKPFLTDVGRRTDLLNLRWFEAGVLADVGRFEESADVYLEVAEAFAAMQQIVEVGTIAIEAADTFRAAGRLELAIRLLTYSAAVMRASGRRADELAAGIALGNVVTTQRVLEALAEAVAAAENSR
jgi:tetratricopeptide (TPR) repeat protein